MIREGEKVAIIKFAAIKQAKGGRFVNLKNAIEYIKRKDRTSEGTFLTKDNAIPSGEYFSSINCNADDALNDMIETKKYYGKDMKNDSSARVGYHFKISFSPKENISYEKAMEITREFCQEYLKGFEVVYAVHTNTKHVHTHIIFNSVNLETGLKYHYTDGDWAKIVQPLLDKICKKHGVHTLSDDTGISMGEYESEIKQRRKGKRRSKKSRNDYYNEKEDVYDRSSYLRDIIDATILEVNSKQEFYDKLSEKGFSLKIGESEKYGEYFAMRTKGMRRFRRNYVLGKDYSVAAIERRINARNKPLVVLPVVEEHVYMFKFKYWKVKYKDMTDLQKKYCYGLYEKGLWKKGQKYDYELIRKSLNDIKNTQEELDLLEKYNIADVSDVDAAVESLEVEISSLDDERKELYFKRKPYEALLKAYDKKKVFDEKGYNHMTASEQAEYERVLNVIDSYSMSEEDISVFRDNFKDNIKDLNRKKRAIKKKIKQLENIRNKADEVLKKEYEYEIPKEYGEVENRIEVNEKYRTKGRIGSKIN